MTIGRWSFLRASLISVSLFAIAAPATAGLLDPPASERQILPVEEALRLQPPVWRDGVLTVSWELAPGIYMYRDRLKFEVIEPVGYALGEVRLADGENYHDDHFGDVRIFRQRAEASFLPQAVQAPKRLRVRYQGCAENLVCYPPQTAEIDVLMLSVKPR